MNKVIAVITALALAVSFVAAGLAVCITPSVTHALSSVFARDDISPFTRTELVKVADATRDFSFGSHDLGKLYLTIYEVDGEYAERLAATSATVPQGFPKLSSQVNTTNANQLAAVFKDASVMYCYDEKTISHLDDCYRLFTNAKPGLIIVAGLAFIGMVVMGVRGGRKKLGHVLMASGIIVVVAFIALGVWAILDFNGFFEAFHKAFFAQQGNWSFPYDSLLICSLPEPFWMGMGVLWLVVTVLLSVLFFVVGNALRKAKGRK